MVADAECWVTRGPPVDPSVDVAATGPGGGRSDVRGDVRSCTGSDPEAVEVRGALWAPETEAGIGRRPGKSWEVAVEGRRAVFVPV